MKTKLLTMATLAWAATAMAGNWVKPTPPSVSDYAAEAEDGRHYYATLDGTGKCLLGANSWGTQASVGANGYEVILYKNLPIGDKAGLKSPTWSIAFKEIGINGGLSYAGDFLFVEGNPDNIFCNAFNGTGSTSIAGGRDAIHFAFTLNEDGKTYRISHPHAAEGSYLGLTDNSPAVPRLYWVTPNIEGDENVGEGDGEGDEWEDGWDEDVEDPATGDEEVSDEAPIYYKWAFIPVEDFASLSAQFAVYEAKVKLYDKLNEAADEYDITNLDDVLAVYNNEESTAAELLECIAILDGRIADAKTELGDTDYTFLIKNADCAGDEGWEGNFASQSARYANDAVGALIEGRFFEKWTWESQLNGDYNLTQKLKLPAGKYQLEASVIAVRQSSPSDETVGVNLFADGGAGLQVESAPISSANNTPELVSIEFNCIDSITIGLKVHNTNANWVAVDNFKLTLLEKFENPTLAELQIKSGLVAEYLDGEAVFSAATREDVKTFITECESPSDTSEEALKALIKQAGDYIVVLEAEIAAYKKLDAFILKVTEDGETYGEYGSFADALGEYLEELVGHYDETDWSAEEIEAAIAGYEDWQADQMIEYIKDGAEPGTDVSVLIKNRDMDQGSRWTEHDSSCDVEHDTKHVCPGWSGTSPKGYDQSAGEFWNMDFDFYQDIEGLPAGKYTVSFQGFYRWGSPEDVAAQYNPDEENDDKLVAVIYGNTVETTFKSICRGRCLESELQHGTGGYATCGYNENGEQYWMPNSMTTFAETIKRDPEAYKSAATAIVDVDGHLRIGIKCKSNIWNRWVIFDQFRLTYEGSTPDLLFEDMDNQVSALVGLRDNALSQHSLPQDISDKIDALDKKNGEMQKSAETTFVDCMNFFTEVNDLKGELQKVNEIINGLLEDYRYYADATIATSDENLWSLCPGNEFQELFASIENFIIGDQGSISECMWATTDDLKAAAKNLNAYHTKGYVEAAQPGGEITNVIRNPELQYDNAYNYLPEGDTDYEKRTDNNVICWAGSWGSTSQYGVTEFYGKNFDMFQDIISLPQGYYCLSADGFYRYKSSSDAVAVHMDGTEYLAAEVYARQIVTVDEETNDTLIWASRIMSICEGAEDKPEYYYEADDEGYSPDAPMLKEVKDEAENVVASLYVPNTLYATNEYIKAGHYKNNKVIFYSDGGDVRIGVRKDSLAAGDWTTFDNFRLFYLGQDKPEDFNPGVAVGVQNTIAVAATKQAYYTIGGLSLARPQKGVNIVITTLPDGTKVTSKVIVK